MLECFYLDSQCKRSIGGAGMLERPSELIQIVGAM